MFESIKPSLKILVVDDDPAVITLIKDNLSTRGYQVFVARDGEEAMENLNLHHPHLVILDMMMPRVDGYEVCTRIKTHPLTRHIPVIMLTAKKEKESHATVTAGQMADRYISKPFDILELEEMVWELLKPGDDR